MATFSVTDRGTFKRCRRQWDYSSNARQNLTRVGPGSEPLELGGLIHRALAGWILDPKANLALIFLNETNKRLDEIKQAYLATVGCEISDDELNPIWDIIDLGKCMMENYQSYWKTPLPDHMTFAAAEQEILVPVPGTEYACISCQNWHRENKVISLGNDVWVDNARSSCEECKGTGTAFHYLSATLDGLLQDEDGLLYVLEHKTYTNVPSAWDLSRTDQFTGYCWQVAQLKIGTIAGVAYDGMWKKKTIPKPYRGVQKTMDDMFLRKTILKSPMEIERWGANLTKEINDMANNPSIYPNIPALGCSGLNSCSFIDLCDAELRDEDTTGLLATRFTQRQTIRIQGIRSEVTDDNDA